jgi:TorA-specific chaperone
MQAQARAASYAFLAWLFLEPPDADFVTRLLADDLQDSLGSLTSSSSADSRIIVGLQMMRSSLQTENPCTVEDMCLALAVERTRLLRGLAREYGPPPPYESLYRSSEASGGNSFLVQMAEFYRYAQIDLPAERADRLDYLGLELDLMRLLCEEEMRSVDQGDTEEAEGFAHLQHWFLQEHLLTWAPQYCESILSHSAAGFYQGVAQLLLGFLEEQSRIEAEHRYGSQELSSVPQPGVGRGR